MAQLCKKLIIKKFSPSDFEFGSKFWKSIQGSSSIIKDFTTENLTENLDFLTFGKIRPP